MLANSTRRVFKVPRSAWIALVNVVSPVKRSWLSAIGGRARDRSSVSDRALGPRLHRAPVRQPVGIDRAHRRRDADRPDRVHRLLAARFELAPARARTEQLQRLQQIGSLAL